MNNKIGQPKDFVPRGSQSALERKYIEDHLSRKGHSFESIKTLPPKEKKRLMIEASRYASLKLAEVESKAKFRERIRYE